MASTRRDRFGQFAVAFRGYNVANLGRSTELLARPQFGPIVERYLSEASQICADTMNQRCDLIERVRENRETTLETYHEAIALIVAMELAQLEILKEFYDFEFPRARMVFGYSLGELTAIIAAGVLEMRHALTIPLAVAADCVDLAENVTMGVLFSRGPLLDVEEVKRLCLKINSEGAGVIGISAILAPNTVLLLGQYATVDRFGQLMHDVMPKRVYLRKNSERWPPVHTPLVWQRNIPNRVGVLAHTLPGGFTKPTPPVFSLVTGKASYTDTNTREILVQWIDHPQRLWDAVYETLACGAETVIHVGPGPNLIPATFQRLRDNVQAQLTGNSLNKLGLRAMARAVRRPWLTAVLPSRTALLRAPAVEHIILEDWLLEQPLPTAVQVAVPQTHPTPTQGETTGSS
ncbi:MAG: ACP S-malonyltransferase [Planctomycetota bacterium]|nr:MAG: ACP S-malonyltransferase [Planctomycetota bacterium]